MKHLFISVLLATACTLGTSAQTIEVTDAENSTYKFAADRVKDISFVKTTAADVIDFNTVDARTYSSGTVEATFSATDNATKVTLWIVGPSMGKYLYEGVYTVSAEAGEMTIDTDKSYSYVTVNGTNKALQSGTMNVAITDKQYTITFDLILEDLSEVKGKYIGEMPKLVGKNATLPVCETPTVKTTDVNDYVKGEYYFKMNDASWSYEMALDFFADASSKKLPEGTYIYSASKAQGTFGTRSCLDVYSPSNTYKFVEGSTVKVSYEGDNIVMVLNLITEDGRNFDMTYNGAITFPTVEVTSETLNLATSSTPTVKDNNGRVDGEFYTKFNDASWNYEMAIDFFAKSTETKLPAGKYTYSTDNTPGTFGSKSYIDVYTPYLGNCKFAEGSTIDVSYSGDNIIMDFNLVIADIINDKQYTMTMKYEGNITYEF